VVPPGLWVQVYAVVDTNGDGTAEYSFIIRSGLDRPMGLVWRAGSLYVSEVSRILRFDKIDEYALAQKVSMAPICDKI
jgi:hypothetical protein